MTDRWTVLPTLLVLQGLVLLVGCGGGSGSSNTQVTSPARPETTIGDVAPADQCVANGSQLNCTIQHDNVERDYILYVPPSYDGNTEVPVLFNFHGYGSTAQVQLRYADFRNLSEQENFLLVVPEGTELEGTTHWAVGSWTVDSTTDDVDFVASLIDKLSTEYWIDQSRIYATGMSNGGYMSYHLACQLSDRIAAIASVTGSMSPEVLAGCNPTHATPVMQIHGTEDDVVPYDGTDWTHSMSDVMDYWVAYNGCDLAPATSPLPDANGDNVHGEQMLYSACTAGVEVQLLKMTGMGHQWPEFGRNDDIAGVETVWAFLSRFSLNGVAD